MPVVLVCACTVILNLAIAIPIFVRCGLCDLARYVLVLRAVCGCFAHFVRVLYSRSSFCWFVCARCADRGVFSHALCGFEQSAGFFARLVRFGAA